MQAVFKIAEKAWELEIHEPARPKAGKVYLSLRSTAQASMHEFVPILELSKPEARAVASALMGAAAEASDF